MTPAQRAQQTNRDVVGRYSEKPQTDPGQTVLPTFEPRLRPFNPDKYSDSEAQIMASPGVEPWMADVLIVRDLRPDLLPAADKLLQRFIRSHWRPAFDHAQGRAAAHRQALTNLVAAGIPNQVGDWRIPGQESLPARQQVGKARLRADCMIAIAANQFSREQWEWALRCDARAAELELATQSGFSRWLTSRRK